MKHHIKHLCVLFHLILILTACGGGGGGGASPTPPSNPISDIPSPISPSPSPSIPSPINPAPSPSPSPSPISSGSPSSPSNISAPIAQTPHRPNITATQFSHASTQNNLTKNLPQTPQARISDENTPKHIGVVDGGFANLQRSSNASRATFLNPALSISDHGTKVSNIILENANLTTNLYIFDGAINHIKVEPNSFFYYAIYEKGARVFNNSFGTNPTPNLRNVQSAFYDNLENYATRGGAIFIWAAGNNRHDNASDEASYPLLQGKETAKKGWIAVTALNTNNRLDTNYAHKLGRAKDWGIAALGTEYENGGGGKGTSFAAPRVTAAVSKVWEKFPWMDNHLVTQTILSTADDYEKKGQPTTGPREDVGWGILNVHRALEGPARFDKRLLLSGQEQVEVNFDYRNYTDRNKLTWSNNIAGDAGLKKSGTGTLYLSGTNTYSGSTNINGGALVLTGGGITQSTITIGGSGRLQANNQNAQTVAGRGLTNEGVFEVYGKGAQIHGNYTAGGGSVIYIDPTQATLEVRGTMDLGKGELIVHIPQIPTIQASTEKSIIQAEQIKDYDKNARYYLTEDSNRYANIKEVKHSSQEIKVQYTRKPTARVLEVANYDNENTLNTAQNFDTLLMAIETKEISENSPVYAAALSVLNADDFTRAIDSLSGEIHASSQNLLVQQNILVNATLNQRVALMQEEKESGFFMQGFGSGSKLAQNNYASADVNLYGTLLGTDFRKDNTTLGVALLLGNAKADFNQYAGNAEILNRHISLYGTQHFKHFYITARAGVGFIKNDVKREINTEQTQSTHKDTAYNLYGEVGKIIPISFARINPFLGLENDYLLRGAFNENHPLGLVADKQGYHLNALSLGIRAALDKGNWRLNTALSHRHLLSPDDFSFEARSVGGDSKVRIQGIKQTQDITTFNVGGMLFIRKDLMLDAQYNFSLQNLSSNYNHSIGLGLRYNY